MKKKLMGILVILIFPLFSKLEAQIFEHYSIFPINRIFFHPAYAGIETAKTIQLYSQLISFDRENIYYYDTNSYANKGLLIALAGAYETRVDEKGKHNLGITVDLLQDINIPEDKNSYYYSIDKKNNSNFSMNPFYTYRKYYNDYKSLSVGINPFIGFLNLGNQGTEFTIFGLGIGTWYQTRSFRGGINLRMFTTNQGDIIPKIDLQLAYQLNLLRINFTPFMNVSLFTHSIIDVGLQLNVWKKFLLVSYAHNLSLQESRNLHPYYIKLYTGTVALVYNTKKNLSIGFSYRIPRKHQQRGNIDNFNLSVFSNPVFLELSARYRFPVKEKK